MARLSGSWNHFQYKDNQWAMVINDLAVLTVSSTALSSSNAWTNDINAPGGLAQSFNFYASKPLQNTFQEMSCSIMAVTSSDTTHQGFTYIPMVRSGSILGIVIHTQDGVVKSGSLSASVMINGANTAVTTAANTGSTFGFTQAKDVTTFNGFQTIGVSLTASSTYLCEPDVTSASFVATVLVEC